jgi:UPF0271 protein
MPKIADLSRKVILSQKLKRYIDLNTDFGQSRDRAFFEDEESSLLNYVSSVNIPCCVHDGHPRDVMQSIVKAKAFNCSIGAHIGLPDPAHHGYEPMAVSDEDLAAWLYVQLGAFRAMLQAHSLEIEHVRPHGALYGYFLTDETKARVVAETLYKMNPWAILVAPVGPITASIQNKVGLRVAPEVYLGKRYNAQGTLIAERFQEDLSTQGVLDQARQLITDSSLTSQDGQTVKVSYNTLHISPRMANSVAIAEKLSAVLGQAVPLSVAMVGNSGWV